MQIIFNVLGYLSAKPDGIDKKGNYVTATLCTLYRMLIDDHTIRLGSK